MQRSPGIDDHNFKEKDKKSVGEFHMYAFKLF